MKEIVLKKYEFNVLDKIYYVYINKNEEDNMAEFYIQEKDYGIIEFMIGLAIASDEIEKFINKNIIEWLYVYNKDLKKLEEVK